MENLKRKRDGKVWKPNFEYSVDYNDHFETPVDAYRDILPLLDLVSTANTNDGNVNNCSNNSIEKKRKNQIIYDPYYCNGRTKIILHALGFDNVVHVKRDFYKDISDFNIPHHTVLVTNPPFSDTHKERCLQFCVKQLREQNIAFFLLMPNYVAARKYYRQILGDSIDDVAYFVPNPKKDYKYSHPEGTGKEESPFSSLWYCGIGKGRIKKLKDHDRTTNTTSHKANNGKGYRPNLVTSFEELVSFGVISLENRPNPRQRKKIRKAAQTFDRGTTHVKSNHHKTEPLPKTIKYNPKVVIKGKKGLCTKYRNNDGKRTRKRF